MGEKFASDLPGKIVERRHVPPRRFIPYGRQNDRSPLPLTVQAMQQRLRYCSPAASHAKDRGASAADGTELGLVDLCKRLNSLLTDVDAQNLSAVERRTLRRTSELISKVLEEIGA